MKQVNFFALLGTLAMREADDKPMFAGCGECDTNFEFEAPTTGLNTGLFVQTGGIGTLFYCTIPRLSRT